MFVTAEVFQDPMGSSKEVAANNRDILVTIPTSNPVCRRRWRSDQVFPQLEQVNSGCLGTCLSKEREKRGILASTLPGIAFRQLPATYGFAQLGIVLEGSAARLQAVAGARHQRQQPHQRHGASVQGVRGNFRRSQRLIYESHFWH